MKRIYTLQNPPVGFSDGTAINWDHYFSKAFDQLKGICAGILCDGVVSNQEADFFRQWVARNSAIQQVWPFSEIHSRIEAIYSDGIVSDEERIELSTIMEEIAGGKGVPTPGNAASPLESAITDPVPSPIIIAGSEFSFTGKFAIGSRSKLVKIIEGLGGSFNSLPRESTNFLVIGVFGSVNWRTSAYGNKIEKAVELRKSGSNIAVLIEESLIPYIQPDSK